MKRYTIQFCGTLIVDAKSDDEMCEKVVKEFQKDIYGHINIEEEEIEDA